jgi:hypothetical protein
MGGSARSKHIDVQYHMVRERIMRGEVRMQYISTNEMVADCMTKALPPAKFAWCREHMGMVAV